MSELKLLAIVDAYLPHAGGSRVYYHNLYKSLVEQFPVRATVLTKQAKGGKEFDAQESTERLKIVRRFQTLPNCRYRQLPKAIFPLAEAAQYVLSGKCQLIHSGDLYPPGAVALAMKKMFGVPYIAFCHGEEITQTDRLRYQSALRDHIYQKANAVVAASEFARQNLIRIGIPESQIQKINPGVDCERFQPRPGREELIREHRLEGKVVLLTVARLYARKNNQAVIRALAKLVREVPNLRYLIVGKGPEEDSLRALVRSSGLQEVVSFLGYVPEEQLPLLYNVSGAFVMPNRAEENGDVEGFGMVFLEANAAGLPVIGGLSGGTREAVIDGTTGFLVDPDDIDKLKATMHLLATNTELRRRMGDAGLRRARNEFTWSKSAKELHELHCRVLLPRARTAVGVEL